MAELIPILGIIMVIMIVITTNKRKLEEKRMAYEERRHAAAPKAPDTSAEKARIADLEDRVRVLERIVTDRGYDLADQIEALRDQRREDARGLGDDSGVALDFAKKEQV
ncbi:hypothetical protein [Aurantiacibacter luteus]|uniref:Uncharacterized protein n=1 Tax=Aurantiacibacter luteus TaxID=1581420 RepID=A0A0G9MX99_9SPHN|nr:hypothetical protein [Aurantiacibacter luteus]KLE33898.1 hypothetical protein AAW00_12595 [Aurantiacibacter luteus]